MTHLLAQWLVTLAAWYFVVGLIVAVGISAAGLHRLDPVAAHGTWVFRLLILPGLTALWPLMLMRVVRGPGQPPEEHNAHRDAARHRSGPA